MWEVDCGVPVETMEEWNKINDVLENLGNVHSAATGFGYRDMQFGCHTEEEAKMLAEKVKKAIKKELGIEVDNEDKSETKAYVTYYELEDYDE